MFKKMKDRSPYWILQLFGQQQTAEVEPQASVQSQASRDSSSSCFLRGFLLYPAIILWGRPNQSTQSPCEKKPGQHPLVSDVSEPRWWQAIHSQAVAPANTPGLELSLKSVPGISFTRQNWSYQTLPKLQIYEKNKCCSKPLKFCCSF